MDELAWVRSQKVAEDLLGECRASPYYRSLERVWQMYVELLCAARLCPFPVTSSGASLFLDILAAGARGYRAATIAQIPL